jgi:hypothetical protein
VFNLNEFSLIINRGAPVLPRAIYEKPPVNHGNRDMIHGVATGILIGVAFFSIHLATNYYQKKMRSRKWIPVAAGCLWLILLNQLFYKLVLKDLSRPVRILASLTMLASFFCFRHIANKACED